MVKAFDDAGLDDLTAEWIVGAEFWPSTEDIPSPDPCEGAREVEHSHFFEENGSWGSLDENGKQVDDGIYQLTDDDTLVFGDFTVGYHIADDTLTFDAVVAPNPCTDDCRGEYAHLISAFYPGEFQRQGSSVLYRARVRVPQLSYGAWHLTPAQGDSCPGRRELASHRAAGMAR